MTIVGKVIAAKLFTLMIAPPAMGDTEYARPFATAVASLYQQTTIASAPRPELVGATSAPAISNSLTTLGKLSFSDRREKLISLNASGIWLHRTF